MIKRVSTVFVLMGVFALVFTSGAQAQFAQWPDRFFVNVNFLSQSQKDATVATTSTFPLYDETATVGSTQTVLAKKSLVDISGGARVFKNFALGIGFTNATTVGTGSLIASIPHPLYYEAARIAGGTVSGLDHQEQAIHVMLMYAFPIGKLQVMPFLGPTFYKVSQDTMTVVAPSETGAPYTTITLSAPTVATTTVNKAGFNIGADVSYKIMRYVGVGAFIRYAGTTVNIAPTGGQAFDLKVGGMQFGAGIRLRY